jgi:serine/threonine protein kinase
VYDKRVLHPSNDIYSLGCIIHDLVYSGIGTKRLDEIGASGKPFKPPEEWEGLYSYQLIAVMAQCLSREPRHRPTAGWLANKCQEEMDRLRRHIEAIAGKKVEEVEKCRLRFKPDSFPLGEQYVIKGSGPPMKRSADEAHLSEH